MADLLAGLHFGCLAGIDPDMRHGVPQPDVIGLSICDLAQTAGSFDERLDDQRSLAVDPIKRACGEDALSSPAVLQRGPHRR